MSTLSVANITGLSTISTSTNTATFGTSVYMVANGNVGIGKSTPDNKLEVSATLAANSVIAKIENLSSASGSQARLDFTTGTPNSYQIIYLQDGATPYGEWSQGPALTGGMYFTSATTSAPIIFRQAATERARIDSSGNFQFNSGYGSVATTFGCRAWVNFNGTSTVAINGSGNVTSITDHDIGNYTINFTTAMPNTNYCVTGSANRPGFSLGCVLGENINRTKTTSACPIVTANDAGTLTDPSSVNVAIFR